MSRTTMIRARVEPSLKEEVERILYRLGLTASEVIHLLYRQIKLRRGLPFNVCLPNRLTSKTLADSQRGKKVRHFVSREELYDDLGL